MTQDLWQLNQWHRAACYLNPRPRARSILIQGRKNPQHFEIIYLVVFKNKKEQAAFLLKYSHLFEPLCLPGHNTLNKYPEIIWDMYVKDESCRRKYSEGPMF